MTEKRSEKSCARRMIEIGTICDAPQTWTIAGDVSINQNNCRLFTVRREGKVVLEVLKNSNRTLTVNFGTEGKYCVRLLARLHTKENYVEISHFGHHYQLVINGKLEDEDYPVFPIDLNGGICVENDMHASFEELMAEPQMPYRIGEMVSLEALVGDAENCFFGDCMPIWYQNAYHLYYLYDRRRHGSKCGYAGHRWAHVSSVDLKHWKRHPFALTIDCVEEATFRTGSLLEFDGKLYAFYVPLMTDGSPSQITYAVSEDGDHFKKTHEGFYLNDIYENVGVRDPNVFVGADGSLHMFLSTKIIRSDGNHRGCILHFTSTDVDHWMQDADPFLVIEENEYPECSDYFEWNGKYYFSYCIHSVSHYMVSDRPFEGFQFIPEQLIGGNGFVVPKSAKFFDRRIAAGFSWTPYFGYGGEPVFLEMFQQPDGTLQFCIPDELL